MKIYRLFGFSQASISAGSNLHLRLPKSDAWGWCLCQASKKIQFVVINYIFQIVYIHPIKIRGYNYDISIYFITVLCFLLGYDLPVTYLHRFYVHWFNPFYSLQVPMKVIHGPLVDEVHQQFSSWIYQVRWKDDIRIKHTTMHKKIYCTQKNNIVLGLC